MINETDYKLLRERMKKKNGVSCTGYLITMKDGAQCVWVSDKPLGERGHIRFDLNSKRWPKYYLHEDIKEQKRIVIIMDRRVINERF